MVEPVGLAVPGPDQMDDRVPPRGQEIGDETPVAAFPGRLGAHEARRRPAELQIECGLPLRRAHAGCIAPEGAHPDAREVSLARLAAEEAAELDCMAVADPRTGEAL